VLLALDDFGTGYASLTHLKTFKVDRLKIDRSFIDGLCDNSSDRAITHAILDLSRSLGICVTAEGIETGEQLAVLRAAGCTFGQGYLFARPMPAEAVPGFLAEWYGARAAEIFGPPETE
jgi:EAL domain-containing protein (putative c-di-GMP-specific phosphodiesterase class I)